MLCHYAPICGLRAPTAPLTGCCCTGDMATHIRQRARLDLLAGDLEEMAMGGKEEQPPITPLLRKHQHQGRGGNMPGMLALRPRATVVDPPC